MFTQSVVATVVSWLGILGGVLTVFGHLQSVFSLSDWGRWLAAHWQSWMMTFWGDYLGFSHLTADSALLLVDLPFFFCLAIIAVASRFTSGSEPDVPRSRKLCSLIAGAVLLASWYVAMVYLGQRGVKIDIAVFFIVYWLVAFLMLSHWPYRLALLSASAITVLAVLLIIANNGLAQGTNVDLAAEVLIIIAVSGIVIFVARPSVFTRQICFLLFFVGALLVVSELSKLGVTLEPPKA